MARTLSIKRRIPHAIELPLGAVADFPGAAAIIARNGGTNPIGGSAIAIIDALQVAGCWPDVVAVASRAIDDGVAAVETIGRAAPDGAIEVTLLPLADGAQVFALFRPLAFESALHLSLIESRQRYKDLAALAGDFAWEVDRDGRFSFASPGALDWPATHLIGREVDEFLADPAEHEHAAACFGARVPTRDAEIWFRRADGGSECLSVSAVPLFDRNGLWQGARGLCRIVTDDRRRSREVTAERLRDRLMVHLMRTSREEIDPERGLAAALSATGLAIAASGAAILRATAPAELTTAAQWGAAIAPQSFESARALLASGRQVDLHRDTIDLIGCATQSQGRRNGAALFWREREQGPFTSEDRAILAAVADALGAAIAQLVSHEDAMALARTDPLTGLLNRRGFSVEATRRLARLAQAPAPACLLYIDLDNFKLVNDRSGHQAGDAVLRDVARILHDNSRSGDLIARLGGDEFAMWLDGVTAATADHRAKAILAQCRPLAAVSGDPARPFGFSLGLVVYDPSRPEGLDALLARADAAMYRVKRGGGGFDHSAQARGADAEVSPS